MAAGPHPPRASAYRHHTPPSRLLHFTRLRLAAGQQQRHLPYVSTSSPSLSPHPIATQPRPAPARPGRCARVSTDPHDRALARAPAPAGRVSSRAAAASACMDPSGPAAGPSSAAGGDDDAHAHPPQHHQVQPLAQAQPQAQPQPQQAAAPPPPPPPQQLSRYESQKRRDWNTFLQYLRNHRPPLTLARCSGAHVIEFLKYLDQFGKTKVHADGCAHFGQPNPPAPCPCPLRQAWGSLDALIGRLRAAYEESGHAPESNPFAARAVRIYLRDVRDAQAKARGIPYEKKSRKRKQPTAAAAAASGEAASSSSAAAAREAAAAASAGDGSSGSAAATKAAPTTGQGSSATTAQTSSSRV